MAITPTAVDHTTATLSASTEHDNPLESGDQEAPPRIQGEYVIDTPPVKEFANEAHSSGVRRLRSALKDIQTLSSLRRQAAANSHRVSFDRFVTVAEYSPDKQKSLTSTDDSSVEESSPSSDRSSSPQVGGSHEEEPKEEIEGNSPSDLKGSLEENEQRNTSSELREEPECPPEVEDDQYGGNSSPELRADYDKQQQNNTGNIVPEVERETADDVDENGEMIPPSAAELEPLSDGGDSEEDEEIEQQPQPKPSERR